MAGHFHFYNFAKAATSQGANKLESLNTINAKSFVQTDCSPLPVAYSNVSPSHSPDSWEATRLDTLFNYFLVQGRI